MPRSPRLSLAALFALASPLGAPLAAQPRSVIVRQGTSLAVAAARDGSQLVFDLQGTLWSLTPGSTRARALSDGLGDDRQPSFSADGREIVFQSYRTGLWKIFVMGRDGGAPRALTDGLADDREPALSPDGRLLGFSSDRSGNYDIWLLDRESGELRALTADPSNQYAPAFSPDGAALAWVSEGADANTGASVRMASLADPTAVREVYRVGAAGGAPAPFSPRPSLAGPTFTPDGSGLLVQRFSPTEDTTTLLHVELASGAARPLSALGDDVFPFRPAFVADPSGCPTVLFTRNGGIARMCLANGEATTVPFEVELSFDPPVYARKHRDWDDAALERPVRGVVAPALSPDGRRVVYTALGDLYLREIGGPLRALTDDAAVEVHPRWSPDGQQLVYTSDRGGNPDVVLHDLSTGTLRTLASLAGGESYPAFSPDGSKVAFFSEEIGRFLSAQLRVVDLLNGELAAPLGPTLPPMPLSFSKDGGAVITTALRPASTRFREGAYQALAIPLGGGAPRFSSPDPTATLFDARFAPNDAIVAYVQDGSLWLADAAGDGTFSGRRAALPGLADAPSWSHDGRFVLVLAGNRMRRLDRQSNEVVDIPIAQTYRIPARRERLVVHAGRLFDPRTLSVRSDVDVTIDGRRISAVAAHDERHHQEARVIDASAGTVLPGLIEMHGHQSISGGQALGRRWLAFGVTAVREPGTDPYDGAERRESWASERRPGPRLFFSGYLLDGSRVYYSIAEGTRDSEHVELALRRAALLDYDLIKTYVRLPDDRQREVVAAAHRLGIPTSSHEIYPAARSGMDAVEHAGATSRRGYSPKHSQLGRAYDDVISILAASGINLTPTLVLPCLWPHLAAFPEQLEHQNVRAFIPEAERQSLLTRGRLTAGDTMAARCGKQTVVAEVVRRGGRVTAGTDAPIVPYGLSLHVELQLLQAAGLTPAEVLRSATWWSAAAIGVERDLGSIEPGKLADLVVIDGNPLERLADTLRVAVTIKDGRVYTLADLTTD